MSVENGSEKVDMTGKTAGFYKSINCQCLIHFLSFSRRHVTNRFERAKESEAHDNMHTQLTTTKQNIQITLRAT